MERSGDDGAAVLATHTFVDGDDPVAARARISDVLVPHELEVHRGLLPFRAVYRVAALDSVSLHYLRYEPEVTMTWAAPGAFHLLVLPITGACRTGSGRRRIEIAPGQGYVFGPETAARLHMIGNCGAVFVKVRASVLTSRLAEATGTSADEPVAFVAGRAAADEGCGALLDLVLWICRDLDHGAPLSTDAVAAAQVERLLLDAILRTCPHDRSELLARAGHHPVPQKVRRCAEFIELHAGESITIGDMTRVSGASERMLFKDFHEHLGTSPMALLRSVRLARAHADLERADAGHDTVAGIARAWGFFHPGRFAADYRRRFGRNPSDTLRRAGDPGYPVASDPQAGGAAHGG